MRFFLNYFSLIWAHNLRLNRYTGIGDPLDMPLDSTLRNCIFLTVLFEEGFSESALRSERAIAPFVERFKAAAILSKSY